MNPGRAIPLDGRSRRLFWLLSGCACRSDHPADAVGSSSVRLLLADYSPWLLITVASAGNVRGSVIDWLLGRGIEQLRDHPLFPESSAKLERARRWYCRYGRWSLLLSWVPIIGDPLTVITGVLREPFLILLLRVALPRSGVISFSQLSP